MSGVMLTLRRARKVMFGSKKKSKNSQVETCSQPSKLENLKTEIIHKEFNYQTNYDMCSRDELCKSSDLDIVRKETLKHFSDKQPFPSTQREYLESDYSCSRYLISAKMNTSQAGKDLAATVLWRQARGLLDHSTPIPDHYHNSFVPVGLDRRKYVVIYSNHARADQPTTSNAESQFDHAFRVVETACNDSLGIQRTLWVIDFNGFGLKHICKKHIVLGCSWFGAHNPERLG